MASDNNIVKIYNITKAIGAVIVLCSGGDTSSLVNMGII